MDLKWILGLVVSALLAVGAESAEPTTQRLVMSLPSDLPAKVAAYPSAPSPSAATVDATSVRAAIEKANDRWLAAFRRGDGEALGDIYAADASLAPASNVNLEGRERIVDYFGAQRRRGLADASLKTVDVVCVGDIAYETGTYGLHTGDDDRAGDAGRYFAIWKNQGDGNWRYQVGIWSSSRANVFAR